MVPADLQSPHISWGKEKKKGGGSGETGERWILAYRVSPGRGAGRVQRAAQLVPLALDPAESVPDTRWERARVWWRLRGR